MPKLSPRFLLAWVILSGLAAGAFETGYLRVLDSSKRADMRKILGAITDEPGYLRFLEEVEARTPPDSTIVIVAPRRWGEGAYEYLYYRAVYVVRSRTILPAIWTDNVPLHENLRSADYLAVWQASLDPGAFEPVWSGSGGGLWVARGPGR